MRWIAVALIAFTVPSLAMATTCGSASVEASLYLIEADTRHQQNLTAAYRRLPPPHAQTYSAEGFAKVEGAYKKHCRKGDTMRVPILLGAIWQNQCDFTKSIVKETNTVTCIRK